MLQRDHVPPEEQMCSGFCVARFAAPPALSTRWQWPVCHGNNPHLLSRTLPLAETLEVTAHKIQHDPKQLLQGDSQPPYLDPAPASPLGTTFSAPDAWKGWSCMSVHIPGW